MQTERSSTALLSLKFMSSIVKTQDELIKTYSSREGKTPTWSVIVSNLRFLIRWLQTSWEEINEKLWQKMFIKRHTQEWDKRENTTRHRHRENELSACEEDERIEKEKRSKKETTLCKHFITEKCEKKTSCIIQRILSHFISNWVVVNNKETFVTV
jgi:hypothetical protein